MIAIHSVFFALYSLKNREKEKRTNWAGHHAICIEYGMRKRERNTNYGTHFHLLSIACSW
jgi:hypothetical protein